MSETQLINGKSCLVMFDNVRQIVERNGKSENVLPHRLIDF